MNRSLAYSTLGEPGMDVLTVISRAGLAGAVGLELRVAPGDVLTLASGVVTARELGERLRAAGLTVLALNSYVALASVQDPTAVDGELRHLLDLADAAGAAGVRVFVKRPEHASAAEGDRLAVERLGRVLGTAAGPLVLIETHDSHSTGASVRALLERLPQSIADRVGVIWDTAHTWSAGEDPARSAALLRPWLTHVQVKDVADRADPRPVDLGTGRFPVQELADALDGIGYDGPVSLEWERTWHPALPPLAQALGHLRGWAAPLLPEGGST
ncbi:sugar phosphate isomerase/epimerase family protein [Occultella kanbiaonis]|uniref:sugar phosphate isomerase/epimerase family protein n=1 Tax=Occultella kanbiaonis TaxID=2675754 RepID=UPI0013D83DF2|nr:sugar phosphate isomerase/epimerase family protein [Occultella kanbiaonis]